MTGEFGQWPAGGERSAEPLDLRDRLWRHRHAAPAAAGELEHGPDEAERRGLAREAADHLRPPPDLDEGALEQVRAPDPLAVLVGEAKMADERVEVVPERA